MSDHSAKLRLAESQALAGKFAEARAGLERVLSKAPGSVEANSLMSYVLTHLGDGARAKYFAQRAVDLRPGDAKLLNNLAGAMLKAGEYDAGIAVFREALQADPRHLSSLAGVTSALNMRHQYMESEALCRGGLAAHPGQLNLRLHLANALLCTGRAREAVREIRGLVEENPEDESLANELVHFMNYAGGLDPAEVAAAHRRYGELLARRVAALPPLAQGPAPSDAERVLRVGVVSGDLRAHAVGFFIEPLLKHHDRARMEMACYSNSPWEDAVSKRLSGMVWKWANVAALADGALARMIRADRIDILIDLSGHTAGHRLGVFAARAAPVQVTYFGCPNTTGVTAMDYRIVDSVTDPREEWYDSLSTERLVRLDPCFLCYSPLADAPEVSPPPAAASGFVTFGSFNNLAKLDDDGVELWVAVLNAVPGSRLFIKHHGLAQDGARALTLRRFTDRGLPAERLLLEGPGAGAKEMLGAYARMDVMLDCYPYHGTTTTCEALYMGVPVVNLAGRHCAARVSTSIVTAAGHPEFAAGTRKEFVRIAADLAGNLEGLAGIRSRLRGDMAGSPVCDGPWFARRFEAALRGMWKEACAGAAARG